MLSKEIIFIDYRELNVYLRILPPPPKSILPPLRIPQGGGKNRARPDCCRPWDLEFGRPCEETYLGKTIDVRQ